MILAGEEWFPVEHLCENAPGTPNVDLHIVLLPCKHDLRGAIVSCRHVTGHLRVLNPGQSEIANLQVAVFIDQDVTRLEITVHDTSRVDIFQTPLEEIDG